MFCMSKRSCLLQYYVSVLQNTLFMLCAILKDVHTHKNRKTFITTSTYVYTKKEESYTSKKSTYMDIYVS